MKKLVKESLARTDKETVIGPSWNKSSAQELIEDSNEVWDYLSDNFNDMIMLTNDKKVQRQLQNIQKQLNKLHHDANIVLNSLKIKDWSN